MQFWILCSYYTILCKQKLKCRVAVVAMMEILGLIAVVKTFRYILRTPIFHFQSYNHICRSVVFKHWTNCDNCSKLIHFNPPNPQHIEYFQCNCSTYLFVEQSFV